MWAVQEHRQSSEHPKGLFSCAVQEHQAKGGKVTVPVGCVGLEDWLLDNVDIYKLLPRLRQGASNSSLLAAAAFAEWCCAALQTRTQAEAWGTCFPSHEAAMCATAVLQAPPTVHGSCGPALHWRCTGAKPACGFAFLMDPLMDCPVPSALCIRLPALTAHALRSAHLRAAPAWGSHSYLPLIEALPACHCRAKHGGQPTHGVQQQQHTHKASESLQSLR